MIIDTIPLIALRRLRANWGPKSESLACYAEVKFVDLVMGWEWYVMAINPDDDDMVRCVVRDYDLRICTWTLGEMGRFYNSHGECPVLDTEYRRMRADILYDKLSKSNGQPLNTNGDE